MIICENKKRKEGKKVKVYKTSYTQKVSGKFLRYVVTYIWLFISLSSLALRKPTLIFSCLCVVSRKQILPSGLFKS